MSFYQQQLKGIKQIDWGKMFVGMVIYGTFVYFSGLCINRHTGVERQIFVILYIILTVNCYQIVYVFGNGFNKPTK